MGSQGENERALEFECAGSRLCGILHRAPDAGPRGVVIVVGGPQYRVGSHRQFVLLARALAARGHSTLRFDYRGMGDGEGAFAGFEGIGEDIRAAVDSLIAQESRVREVVVWGLCDAASAACFYAWRDARVVGLVLVNPWVRSAEGIARAYLRHYYLSRVSSRELWGKIFSGRFDISGSLRSFTGMIRKAIGAASVRPDSVVATDPGASVERQAEPLAVRMRRDLERFQGRVLLILSGNDLTAAEFTAAAKGPRWRRLLLGRRVAMRRIGPADHTFSRRAWRDQVAAWTGEWLVSW